MMAPKRVWNEELNIKLRKLCDEDKTAQEIAVALGVTVSAVYHQVHRLGIRLQPWDAAKDSQLRELCNGPMSVEQVAKKLRSTPMAVYKRLSKLGVKRKPPMWTAETNDVLRKLYAAGSTVTAIASTMGCSEAAIQSQVQRLKLKRREKTSKYHGVSYVSTWKTWRAVAYSKKTGQVVIGTYPTEMEAAKAYDSFIKRMGWDRPLNFPK